MDPSPSDSTDSTSTDTYAETPLEDWVEDTTGLDRIISVLLTLDPSERHTASEIADEARVSTNTARAHMERLERLHIVEITERPATTLYQISPDYLIFHSIKREARQFSTEDEVHTEIGDIEQWIAATEDEYGTRDPNELYQRADSAEGTARSRDLRKQASELKHAISRKEALYQLIHNDIISI